MMTSGAVGRAKLQIVTMVMIWSFARPIAPVVPTMFIILSANKTENGDYLIPAYAVILEVAV